MPQILNLRNGIDSIGYYYIGNNSNRNKLHAFVLPCSSGIGIHDKLCNRSWSYGPIIIQIDNIAEIEQEQDHIYLSISKSMSFN